MEDNKKKIGMSILSGLLFGLVAGVVMVVIFATFKQEGAIQTAPNNGSESAVVTEDGTATEQNDNTQTGKNPEEEIKNSESKPEDETAGTMADINEINEEAEIEVADASDTKATVVTDVTEVVDEVMPCVVSIFGTYVMEEDFWGYSYNYETEGGGSGIIVGESDTELLLATNNHVVEDSEELTVQFIDDSVASAKIKGTDKDMDLAVIAVKLDDLDPSTKKIIRIATLGNSDLLKVGEPAIAIGNALGYGQSVTTGVISAVNRAYTDDEGPLYGAEGQKDTDAKGVKFLIQTDAAINPGNSGGALLNVRGEVIGINSSKIASNTIEGMGYAIPISTAEPILKKLMERKTTTEKHKETVAYLGISGMAVPKDLADKCKITEGIYITQVFDKTPAQKAGLNKGDILLEIDGYTTAGMDDLTEIMSYYEENDKVTVKTMKRTSSGYQPYETTVILGGK